MNKKIFIIFLLTCTPFAFAENVIVYQQSGKFCAWPANEGVWSWGNEILVGFNIGVYKYNPDGHSVDPDYATDTVQARSLDGGQTWTLETPQVLNQGGFQKPIGAINFTHPDFAYKSRLSKYYFSYDRGRNWQGPFEFPKLDQTRLIARTDYIVNSQCEVLFFVTAAKSDGVEGRTFCAVTKNAGRTFDFLSWVAPSPPIDAGDHNFTVMSSTVKIADDTYITALRQRRGNSQYIDIYKSIDGAKSWNYLSLVVNNINNPPAMLKLADGRICIAYGQRYSPYGIKAKISTDNGQTWGSEITLRNDGLSWDLGYPRSIQRPDGKIVTIYYYATVTNPQQHIAATIWQP
ncbi:MAG: hypothetical protein A2Y10_01120 [Planctomycetes bacterium GWF2_41_51]|nr:MAG: hypothetical protein A2Y10_01120 [Planctomycetes bacterium GWF2_41_51]